MGRIAVIGAGITGLAAAWELGRSGEDVVVFEASDRIGGKIHSSPVPGLDHPLEDAADAFLARVPDAIEACEALGLDDLVSPAARNAFVYARGALRPLPSGQLLGLPTDLDELAATGLLSARGIERARLDLTSDAPPLEGDITIGALVRERLGDEVLDHLVQPLVGGINVGEADLLSVAAVAPQHLQAARHGGSLVEAARAMRSTVSSDAPVFLAPRAGMSELTARLAEASGATIRLGRAAGPITTGADGVRIGDDAFDGVAVTAPAHAAADLLRAVAPAAAAHLGAMEFSSVVMVTVVHRRSDVEHPLDGSGFVVARTEGLSITAASWGSSKWAHWGDDDTCILRVSLGHDASAVPWCDLTDADLVAAVRRDLRTTMGIEAEPAGVRVTRWPRSLAQYRVGHLDRVAEIHAEVAEAGRLAVGGASLEGVGVPACIRQGRAAARRLLG